VPHPQALPFVVALASSSGGVAALQRVIGGLPAGFPGALLVVQHQAAHTRPGLLAGILGRAGALPVYTAREGQAVLAGHVYVAPPGQHLSLADDHTLALDRGPAEHHARPSAEPLFRSVARVCGPLCAAVVLTGGDGDGSVACADVAAAGGTVMVQDPAEAESPAMPLAALRTGCVSVVASLDDLPSALLHLVTSGS
jgi:two-component system, chemotaxis family, protein-glutamate methylesterase/glutaminase